MKKSILIIIAFGFVIFASLAFIISDVPKYKNLKILKKNISKAELDSIMRFYSFSVGKKCNFCHVKIEGEKSLDFVSDANPHKLISRKMMLMTNKINKRFFRYEKSDTKDVIQSVTCYTCHNGQAHPETKGKLTGDSKKMFPRDGDRPVAPDSIRPIQGDTIRLNQ